MEILENADLPSPISFFIQVPIYKSFKIDESNCQQVLEIENFEGTIDTYCVECQQDSTFKVETSRRQYGKEFALTNRTFVVYFKCARDENHIISFYTRVHNNLLQKVGQHPSIADLNKNEIKKYRKILGNEKYKELSKAVGLVSYGIGIGSFVYLRRIFEDLIKEAHEEAIKLDSWNEDNYNKSRMDEKIGLLKNLLPPFLVQNKIIYSILSKGIHELSEKDCLRYFDYIKLGIELILDEKLEKINRESKIEKVKKGINDIHHEIL